MPYIKKEDRKRILIDSDYGLGLRVSEIETAGELQYAMAIMFKDYIKRKGEKYQNYNDVMGAVSGASLEFYRRHVAPYEDGKIEGNGDV